MVGNGMGAKNGILFKTSEALENAGKVQIVALDKTGTITAGKPEVTDIFPAEGVSGQELLGAAYALEQKSEHPLARAIVEKGDALGLTAEPVADFEALAGHGLKGTMNGQTLYGGSGTFISSLTKVPESLKQRADSLAEQGKTPLFFTRDGKLIGIIAVADVIKDDSAQAVKELQNMGIEVVMLTGDNERTARAIGDQAGVDRVIAGVLPDGKESVIRSLQKRGKVAMVGDGINDAPALTRADTGIAIGAGTDVAIDSADVVLMNSKLTDVSGAVRLSRATLRNIHENLFWAFAYNVILIPMAAGLYHNIQMNPMWGAAAMSLSSFTVCMNALRLNLFKVHSAKHDHPMRKRALPETESAKVIVAENAVNGNPGACPVPAVSTEQGADGSDASQNTAAGPQKTAVVSVDGMMCNMCEKHVSTALLSVPGITAAKADHTTGKVDISFVSNPDEEAMRKAIADADYEYKGIKYNQEDQTMTETAKIEGMMCNMCEKHVKNALEGLDGVENAVVSHDNGTAVMTVSKKVAEADVKKAVEDAGYKFVALDA